ncbi:MAG: hypothetical protein COA82_08370 [Alkaliphilus sp.]|nr:hypothetical protein [bacterium AH-315-L21]PHS33370.1 MAG: hypothetical protein COA82_08370 [Alkaliphilus sp.]
MIKKRWIVVIICIVALTSSLATVNGNPKGLEDEMLVISPQMLYISSVSSSLHMEQGAVIIICSLRGYRHLTDKVRISSYLQQNIGGRWTTIKHFTETFNSHSGTMFETHTVEQGYSYRAMTFFYAYGGHDVESQVVISNIVQ